MTFDAAFGIGMVHVNDHTAAGPSLINLQAGYFVSPRTSVGLRLATTSLYLDTVDGDALRMTSIFLGLCVQRWIGNRFFFGFGTGAFAFATESTDNPFDGYANDGYGLEGRIAYAHPVGRNAALYAAVETFLGGHQVMFTTTSFQLGAQVF
jgi:hypothetical protein